MKYVDTRSLAVGALIGAAIVLSIGASTAPRTKWEYKISTDPVFNNLEHKLNEDGKVGWEATGFSIDGRAGLACALLKRPVE